MTFNHFEIPISSNNLSRSTHLIYDGPNISIIHDGVSRYIYLKDTSIGVKFKEPNTDLMTEDTAFIIGSNNTNLYILNPSTRQLRSIDITNLTNNEKFYNLNDYNKFKDLSYGNTGNNFIPTCGHVNNSTIVIGGYMNSMQPGVIIEGQPIVSDNPCYMYSIDNGLTFLGPFFPFINTDTNTLYLGRIINLLFTNNTWIFYMVFNIGAANGVNLNSISGLGLNFNGTNLYNPFLETPNALLTNWSLPMKYFDNRIFFQNTTKTGYHIYSFIDNSHNFNLAANITAMTIVNNELKITNSTDCSTITIPAI